MADKKQKKKYFQDIRAAQSGSSPRSKQMAWLAKHMDPEDVKRLAEDDMEKVANLFADPTTQLNCRNGTVYASHPDANFKLAFRLPEEDFIAIEANYNNLREQGLNHKQASDRIMEAVKCLS